MNMSSPPADQPPAPDAGTGQDFDEAVVRAMARWPNVPECFGWLGLDARGRWLLQGEVLAHPGLIEFIGRNYTHDAAGRWFFQNGPQRVYVTLECTPWVYRLDPPRAILTHTGRAAQRLEAAFMDEQERCLLLTDLGIGLLDGRDVPVLVEGLSLTDATAGTLEQALERLAGGVDAGVCVRFGARQVPLQAVRSDELGRRFGFVAQPAPTHGSATAGPAQIS